MNEFLFSLFLFSSSDLFFSHSTAFLSLAIYLSYIQTLPVDFVRLLAEVRTPRSRVLFVQKPFSWHAMFPKGNDRRIDCP